MHGILGSGGGDSTHGHGSSDDSMGGGGGGAGLSFEDACEHFISNMPRSGARKNDLVAGAKAMVAAMAMVTESFVQTNEFEMNAVEKQVGG